jgi:hypothetical protein
MTYSSFEQLSSYVIKQLNRNQLEDCLVTVKEYVGNIINVHILDGLLIDIPGLDDLCLAIGKKILPTQFPINPTKSNVIIYIATQLYIAGGHTAVIEDFIKAQPDKQHIILLTDIFNVGEENKINKRFDYLPVKLIFAPNPIYLKESLVWLQKKWIELKPEKVFLFNHHQDVVAISAAQPQMPGQLFYYHHTDFQLGLGARLKHAKHIDMNPLAYYRCRDNAGLNNIYCPLTCTDLNSGEIKIRNFMANNKINTASSGACQKFIQHYLYSYVELLPEIIEITQGTHLHIGYLPPKILNLIQKKLRSAKIPMEKFIYLPWVKSVGMAMLEHNIDLYITSFPIGGGRTAIEIMASATPILCHLNYRSIFLSENNLLYSEAFTWKTSIGLKKILSMLTSNILKSQAILARNYYLAHYSDECLVKAISSDFQTTTPQKIKITDDALTANSVQFFLDLATEIKKLQHESIFWFMRKAKIKLKNIYLSFRYKLKTF